MIDRGPNLRIRLPSLAVIASASALAIAAAGCGNDLDTDNKLAEKINGVEIGADKYENDIRVNRYDPEANGHPEYRLWGLVQYCEDGKFSQAILSEKRNEGDPADVSSVTRARFDEHDAICEDGKVEKSELPRQNATTTPTR